MDTATKLSHSEEQAAAQLESIKAMVAALNCDYARLEELREERASYTADEDANAAPDGPGHANDAEAWAAEYPDEAAELATLEQAAGEDCADRDDAETRIQQDPLSVMVRSGWHATLSPGVQPAEYEILLCTGGPACRIRGCLDDSCEPSSAHMEHQDWGKPWAEWPLSRADEDIVLRYARCFFYGE